MPDFDTRVCIIGAGPSGLCSLKHVLSSSQNIQVLLFEQQVDIGGVWNYTGSEIKLWDDNGKPVVFPMYSGLRCNLPKQLMEFHDFKNKSSTSDTFATQQEMHEYLLDYADHFQLWPYINVNSRVLKLKPLMGGANTNDQSWLVTVVNTQTSELTVFNFDYVVCCVGVNFYPKIPHIDGMSRFKGRIIHSKYFKDVDEFRDKRVVCMGLGPSSADLCLKLAPVVKQVVACHRFPGGFSLGILPPNAKETVNVKKLAEHSVITENDEEIPCDVLILCTGYKPHFPFLKAAALTPSSHTSLTNNLYKKMFFPQYPSLCFINAHGIAEEFLVMEIQAKYFVSMLENKFTLPSLSVMEKIALQDSSNSNKSQAKLSESLRGEQYAMEAVQEYLEDLAEEGDFVNEFRHIPLHLRVWQFVIGRIFGSLALYRSDSLKILTSNHWEYTCAPEKENQESRTRTFILKTDGTVNVKDEEQVF